MRRLSNRSIGFLLSSAVFFAGYASAQTPEAVLRGLQERQVVLGIRAAVTEIEPIVWPDGLDPFPQDGDITDFRVMIKALNVASRHFDRIRYEFISYDPLHETFVNLRHHGDGAGAATPEYTDSSGWVATSQTGASQSGSKFQLGGIGLLPVGDFDETNWREKLVKLASNIDQLRTLAWPTHNQAASMPPWRSPIVEQINRAGSISGWSFEFPSMSNTTAGYAPPLKAFAFNAVDESGDLPALNSSGYGIGFELTLTGGGTRGFGAPADQPYMHDSSPGEIDLNCTVGMVFSHEPLMDDVEFFDGAAPIDGDFHVFKGPAIFEWGDMTENLGKLYPDQLGLGKLTLLQNVSAPVVGTFNFTRMPGPDSVVPPPGSMPRVDVLPSIAWMDLPALPISASVVEVPVTPVDVNPEMPEETTTHYHFAVSVDNDTRRAVGSIEYNEQTSVWRVRGSKHFFKVHLLAVFSPHFTKVLPPSAQKGAAPSHPVASIEPTMYSDSSIDSGRYRIHIGRGVEDQNQEAFLTTRKDAFGSVLFSGSPTAFEVLYEEDWRNFQDAPAGDATLGTAIEFSPTQCDQSGWLDRYSYYMEWLSPRLMQVKGGDVLVDISYTNPYSKTLHFYWTKQITGKSGKFYTATGAPFKEIIIRNPTVPAPGELGDGEYELPTDQERIEFVEDNTRFYDLKYETSDYLVTKITLKLSNSPASSNPTPYAITELNISSVPDVLTHTAGGLTTTSTFEYESGFGPSSDRPALKSASITSGGETRTFSCEWDVKEYTFINFASFPPQPTAYQYPVPMEANWTGPATWAENGKQVVWGGDGLLSTVTKTVSGKTLTTSHGTESSGYSTTASLDGQDFRLEEHVFSLDWLTEEVFQGGQLEKTLSYGSSASTLPWRVTEVNYPSGYRQQVSRTNNTDSYKIDEKEGWGGTFASGTTRSSVFNLWGGLISSQVTTGAGVVLSNEVGSSHTGWGAPRSIQDLQGNSTSFTFEETGANFGAIKRVDDPSGAFQTVTQYDWLSRPQGIGTQFGSGSFNYNDPLKTVFQGFGGTRETTVSSFGDTRKITSTGGVPFEVSNDGTGTGSLKVDNREVPLGLDNNGTLKSIQSGLGSRGAQFDFGVENGLFYTDATPLKKNNGADSAARIRTFYDALGRKSSIVHLGAAGSTVTDTWTYTNNGRTVTHTPDPEAGPRATPTTTTISEDGSTVTLRKGSYDLLRTIRSAAIGAVRVLTELNDDSTGTAQWTEARREVYNPLAKSTLVTPWALTANTVVTTESVADGTKTITTSGGLGLDSKTLVLEGGIPTSISGINGGETFDFSGITITDGRLRGLHGSIGEDDGSGQNDVHLLLDAQGRTTGFTAPGTAQTLNYGGAPGFQTTIQDTVRGTTNTIIADSVGDLTSRSGAGDITIGAETNDLGGGKQATTLNTSVTTTRNQYGSIVGKTYTGGVTETYNLNNDGSPSGFTISGPGGSVFATIADEPLKRTTQYSDGTTYVEDYYQVGPRSSVMGPNDGRTFKYQRLALKEETHTQGGVWSGWKVERLPDAKGRLGTVKVTGPGAVTRSFFYGYDTFSRLTSASTLGLGATYTLGRMGRLEMLDRGIIAGLWTYYNVGSLESFFDGHGSYQYFFQRDGRQRVTQRTAGVGTSWDLSYNGSDQLLSADVRGRTLYYDYDGRGNRTGQGPGVSHVINGLDQIQQRNVTSRTFGLLGTVSPQATVKMFHPLTPGGTSVAVDPETGGFSGWWGLPASFLNGNGGRLDLKVQGTIPGAGANGTAAVAEVELYLPVAPSLEVLEYDGAGRLKADAFWTYQWDAAGRLTTMERKANMKMEPALDSESVAFVYDADGRRTWKQHDRLYTGGRFRQVTSRVLWSGTLPIMEEYSDNEGASGRRWFVWGNDLSRTLDGAGGIGGLVGIIDEPQGKPVRKLLPVQDGLGNVTTVVDQATGQEVARYDYGPFGEPLGESGEVDVCPFRWQTKWYDKESQHYYFLYRHYDPRLGRWLSRDPIGESGGLNLYAYCGNDPVNRHDPLGLATVADGAEPIFTTDPENEAVAMVWFALSMPTSKRGLPPYGTRETGQAIKASAISKGRLAELMRSPAAYGSWVGDLRANAKTQAISGGQIQGLNSLVAATNLLPGGKSANSIIDGNHGRASLYFAGDVALTLTGGKLLSNAKGGAFLLRSGAIAGGGGLYHSMVDIGAARYDAGTAGVPYNQTWADDGVLLAKNTATSAVVGVVLPMVLKKFMPAGDDLVTVYRGVRPRSQNFGNALDGKAFPIGGSATIDEHIAGNTASNYTSWTFDIDTAADFATKTPRIDRATGLPVRAPGGVILELRIPRSELIIRPTDLGEFEALIEGPVAGAIPRILGGPPSS